MLDLMRRHSQSYLIYFFFAVIIIVFVFFFGPQSSGCSPSQTQTVAQVYGTDISSNQLIQLYGRIAQVDRRRQMEYEPLSRQRQIMIDLAFVRLVAEEARSVGIEVSDEQFSQYIQSSENQDLYLYSNRQGDFELALYERGVPGNFGVSLDEYEAWKSDELLARRYLSMLTENVLVTEDEINALNQLRNTQFNLDYVSIDPSELDSYFPISPEEMETAREDESSQNELFYTTNIDNYSTPRQMRFSRILLQFEFDGDEESLADTRTTFDEIMAALEEDSSQFSALAVAHSMGAEAVEGGDLGLRPVDDWVTRDGLREQMGDLALNGIVTHESERSLVIYQMTEDQPALVESLDDVLNQVIVDRIVSERGTTPYEALAQSILDGANSGLTLVDAMSALPLNSSDNAEIVSWADVITVENTGPFSISQPPLNPSAFGLPAGFSTAGLGRSQPGNIQGLGQVPALSRALSTLTTESPVAPEVYQSNGSLIVARLNEIIEAEEGASASTELLRQEIHQEKVTYLLGSWERRLFFHDPNSQLGTFLLHLWEESVENGHIKIFEGYFVPPPVLEESSQG